MKFLWNGHPFRGFAAVFPLHIVTCIGVDEFARGILMPRVFASRLDSVV